MFWLTGANDPGFLHHPVHKIYCRCCCCCWGWLHQTEDDVMWRFSWRARCDERTPSPSRRSWTRCWRPCRRDQVAAPCPYRTYTRTRYNYTIIIIIIIIILNTVALFEIPYLNVILVKLSLRSVSSPSVWRDFIVLSYACRLDTLGLNSLYCRRIKSDLVVCYKILNNLVCIDVDTF